MENENKVNGTHDQETESEDVETEEEESTEEEEETLTPEEIADLKRKAEASSKNFERAKKAEEKLKKFESAPSEKKEEQENTVLSYKDQIALNRAEIDVEDVEEVVKLAKFYDISVSEAVKDTRILAVVKTNQEYRASEKASNTKATRSPVKKISGAELIKQSEEGKIPEKGSPEAEELFWAKRGGRRE